MPRDGAIHSDREFLCQLIATLAADVAKAGDEDRTLTQLFAEATRLNARIANLSQLTGLRNTLRLLDSRWADLQAQDTPEVEVVEVSRER